MALPMARNWTRRLGLRRGTGQEPPLSASARKDISLPLNLVSSPGLFDDLVRDDGSFSFENTKLPDYSRAPSTEEAAAPTVNTSSEPDADSPATPSLTDASSVEGSPIHDRSFLSATLPNIEPVPPSALLAFSDAPPAIPKRVPSHSKKEHVRLARKRSLRSSDMASPGPNAAAPKAFFSTPPALHEDPLLEADEESRLDILYMHEHGLIRYTATDYQADLATLSPWSDGIDFTSSSWL